MTAVLQVVPEVEDVEPRPISPARRPADKPMSREDRVRKASLALDRMERTDPSTKAEDRDWLYEQRERLNALLYRVTDASRGGPFTAEESRFIGELQTRRDKVVHLFSKFDFMGL